MINFEQLEDLRKALDTTDPADREAFSRILCTSMDLLELSDVDVSEAFDVSRPSVRRWKSGISTPTVAMRRLILRRLLDMANGYVQIAQ